MNLTEQELVRARWRRALGTLALDRTDRSDFAATGLSTRLASASARLVLLPHDPEVERITFDGAFEAWFKAQSVVCVDGVDVELPPTVRRTAHALVRADSFSGDGKWTSYLAIHRSGALECGLGDRGGWEGHDGAGNPQRAIALTPIVARAWALLQLAASSDAHRAAGPFMFALGIAHTRGAVLAALAQGWPEPGQFQNHVGGCADEHLLWHLEVADAIDDEGAQNLAHKIGGRIEDAWGCAQRRFLIPDGQLAGHLDPRYVH